MMQGDQPLTGLKLVAQIVVNAILRSVQPEQSSNNLIDSEKNSKNAPKRLDFRPKRSVTTGPKQ